MAAFDVAGAIANTKTMLAALPAWQTICGVDNATEAAQRIHEGGTEEESETVCPHIILDVTSLPTNWLGNHFRGRLSIEVRCELAIPEAQQRTYSTQYVWMWEKFGTIMEGINGAVGDASQMMADSLEVPVFPGRVDPNTNGGRVEWGFVLSLSCNFQ